MTTIPPESKKSMLPGHTVPLCYVPRIFHGNFSLFSHPTCYLMSYVHFCECVSKKLEHDLSVGLRTPPPHFTFYTATSSLTHLPSLFPLVCPSPSLSSPSSLEPRPIPPPVFNEGEVRQQLVEYYRANHRSPGEPILVPELHHNHAITQQCPR